MKSKIYRLLITASFISCLYRAKADDPPIRIAEFKGDRSAAISYTFDDGLRDQADLIVPVLDRLGLHATFFIVASLIPDTDAEASPKPPGKTGISWERLREMAASGHEIANHTWTHKVLRGLEESLVREEIDLAYDCITEKIGTAPVTFCFPGNAQDDRVRAIALEKHMAVRQFQKEFGEETFTTEEANAWAEDVLRKREWGVVMIHGIESGYHAFSSAQVLIDHLEYIKAHQDEIWVDYFGNVASYRRTREFASLRQIDESSRSLTFVVESAQADSYPVAALTIGVKVGKVNRVTAKRDGKVLPTEIRGEEVLIEAAPASKPIVVNWD